MVVTIAGAITLRLSYGMPGFLDNSELKPSVQPGAAVSWRSEGVSFYIRAGKWLVGTCTEVFARFRKPPSVISGAALPANHFRFRISPDVSLALGAPVMMQG